MNKLKKEPLEQGRSLLFALILAHSICCCKGQEQELEHAYEDGFSNLYLPDGKLFQVYGKMYGRPKIRSGQVVIYLNSWLSGERRYIISQDSILVTNPMSGTLYEANLIPNPDTAGEDWIARPAELTDTLPPIKFKSYVVKGTRKIYDSLTALGLDTMRSPRNERWDLHENRFYIIESFIDDKLNMFQFTLTDVKNDKRYRWIDTVFMSIDPGKSERARRDQWYQ